MTEEQNQIRNLQQQLDDLQKRQVLFQEEITRLRDEIGKLIPRATLPDDIKESSATATKETEGIPETPAPEAREKSDIERFIGENLINKIGIAITVTGVGIGAKYAIDHQLISPVLRIVLGYLVGFGLLIFALRLKKQYANFSAVLLSGSMAIMYLITYAAYSLYNLYPQPVAFVLMVIFTAMTVTGALRYDREIIAIIGMVGAFAIPFLLREGSDRVMVFFSYVALIDTGILIVAVRKYWKPLYFSAFVFTWLIYLTWFLRSYKAENDSYKAMFFLLVFFIIFYLTFLSYKLLRKEKFNVFDVVLLLANSFICYGTGYAILKSYLPQRNIEGLFTLGNAFFHAAVSFVIYRNKLADKNLFYLVSGLAVVFLTLAVPVQLNGSWVTLFWICEAVVLIGIGRIRGARIYENMSYVLIALAFFSQLGDWTDRMDMTGVSEKITGFIPVFNISFLSTLIYIAAFALFVKIYFSDKYPSPFAESSDVKNLLNYVFAGLFILMIYLTFLTEISAGFNRAIDALRADLTRKDQSASIILMNTLALKRIWIANYSLLFLAFLSSVNTWKVRLYPIGVVVFWLTLLTVFLFLTQSLYDLSELRESYMNRSQAGYSGITVYNILIRYISIVILSLPFAALFIWIRNARIAGSYRIILSLAFHLSFLWILCSEILNISDLLKNAHSYKFGLSILSGVYALVLIVLGITGRKRYLRIAAMVLLGVTLVKLFFYDITRLDTILKTILFLALGTLFLLISFLYNKYRIMLFGEEGDG